MLGFSVLIGCQQKTDDDNNEIVSYEYLSLDKQYSNEINQWLHKAKKSTDERIYGIDSDDGNQYVYAKGYKQAKVSYTYETFDGKVNSSIKATLLKGQDSDEVLIKITYNTDVDGITLDATDDKDQFYN